MPRSLDLLPRLEEAVEPLMVHPMFLAVPPWERLRCEAEMRRRLLRYAEHLLPDTDESSPLSDLLPPLVQDLQEEVYRDLFERSLRIALPFAKQFRLLEEDVAREAFFVFLKAFRSNPGGFPTENNVEKYLTSVCFRVVRGMRRAEERQWTAQLSEGLVAAADYLAAHQHMDDVRTELARVYAECTEREKQVLDRLLDGKSPVMIADELLVNVNTVHKVWQRIRDKFNGRDLRTD
jgi:DNA-binding CsgD family transcriptional regulator